uniref:Uncharacterized protein n=1 Tax=Panagrolaimus sp. ES5 TaxID=591445 RepID=A0AC34GLC7_9BILA
HQLHASIFQGVNELEPTMKVEVRSPTSSMIETLEKLDSNKPDMIFERYRAEMQKDKEDKEEEDLFDLLNRPSTKVATMDVDAADWPSSSVAAKSNDDGDDDELELFKKLKPINSQLPTLAIDEDWPVTTLPPPLEDQKDDEWNDFNAFSDDFAKKEKDVA